MGVFYAKFFTRFFWDQLTILPNLPVNHDTPQRTIVGIHMLYSPMVAKDQTAVKGLVKSPTKADDAAMVAPKARVLDQAFFRKLLACDILFLILVINHIVYLLIKY